jgi:transglutaminase-like putative cysteine protease
VALATAATGATAATLGGLMATTTWVAPLVVALAATGLGGVAAALARLPASFVVPVSWLGGLAVCTALFAPDRALLGGFVPTPASLVDLRALVDAGIQVTRTAVPPVPVGPELQALVAVAMVHVGVVVIAVSAWLGHPGLAGLPLMLVVFVAAALTPGGLEAGAFLVAAAGYLLLTLTDADRRVALWGPLLRRRSESPAAAAAPVAGSYVPQAAAVGAVALAASVIVPTLVPAMTDGDLAEAFQDRFGDGGVQRVQTVNPFLDLRRDLTRPEDAVVLEYATDDATPDPLRIVTLDVFDSATWQPSEPQLPVSQTVDRGLPPPPGARPALLSASGVVTTQISVTTLDQRYLPLPYPATRVDIDGTWLFDPETLNVLSGTDTTLGKRYVAESIDIRPDAESLRTAPAPPVEVVERYGGVPADTPAVVADTAASVTSGAASDHDRAVALQQYFRTDGGFTYSLDAPETGGVDVMAAFLEQRRGYCVQFASTMAVMARTLGIPSRVAVGFLPGDETGPGIRRVGIRDAHAWPELYFEGTGWVRFEPTPSARTGGSPEWAQPATPEAPAPPAEAAVPSAAPAPDPRPEPTPEAAAGSQQANPPVERAARAGGAVVLALAVVAAAALSPRAWRDLRDRLRWRRAGSDPRARAAAAWLVMRERLADLGHRGPAGTIREQAAALVAAEEPDLAAREALGRIVSAVEGAWFTPSPTPAPTLEADTAAVVAGVARQRGRWQRGRARWLPAPSAWRGPEDRWADAGEAREERERVPPGARERSSAGA